MDEQRPLLSLPEVATLLGRDQRTIRRWADLHTETNGALGIPSIQITPRLRMVSRPSLDAWLLGQHTAPSIPLEAPQSYLADVISLKEAN